MPRLGVPTLTLLALLAPAAALTQSAQPSLQGTVRDETGAVLVGVTVTVTHTATGSSATTVTNESGGYGFARLASGAYRVRAALPRYRTEAVEVVVTSEASLSLDFTLRYGPVTDTVTVTRTEQELSTLPQAVALVDRREVTEGQRKVSLAESLRSVPGVFVQDRQNFSESNGVRLSVRAPVRGVGIGIRGVQVVQDGVPLTMADGITQLSNVDLGTTERIEVIRGPSSVLYGNAAAGVVTLHTQAWPPRPFTFSGDIQTGSDGYRRQQIQARGTARRVGYAVSVSHMATDGWRAHSRAESTQAGVVIGGDISPSTGLRAVFNVADVPFAESPSTLTYDEARMSPRSVRALAIAQGFGEASTQALGGLTIERRLSRGGVARVTGWTTRRDVWNPIPFRIIDVRRAGAGLRMEVTTPGAVRGLPLAWTAGVDISHQRDDRSEHDNAGVGTGPRAREGAPLVQQVERVASYAPFVQVTASLRERWTVVTGLRFDAYRFSAADQLLTDGNQSGSRRLHAASPMAGLTYAVDRNLSVYGTFASAYETPTAQELSNKPSGEGGFNDELEPEVLRSLEAGARGQLPRWRMKYEVAGYASRLDDALVQSQRADEQDVYRNAGASSRRGVEAVVDWTPVSRLTARLAYTYQRFRFVRFATDAGDYSGHAEPGAPPHQTFAALSWDSPFAVRSTAQVRWTSAYVVNNANTVSNWQSRVVDLRFVANGAWRWLDARPFLGIDNLFSERYNGSIVPNAVGARFFEPSPGRAIYVGLTVGVPR